MTVMVTEVYDTLREAGASEEKSRRAAGTPAQASQRFAKIDTDLAVLKWMMGFTLAGVTAIAIRMLSQ